MMFTEDDDNEYRQHLQQLVDAAKSKLDRISNPDEAVILGLASQIFLKMIELESGSEIVKKV